MRRLALSLVSACGLALLSACSGGTGFGNNGSSLSAIVFSNGSAQVANFFVAPGGTSPLRVAAVGVESTPGSDLVYGQTFLWAARFVNPLTDPASIATYTTGVSPSTFKTCAAPPKVEPPVPILVPAPYSDVTSGFAGYTALGPTQPVSTVYVAAVPGVAAPYCLVLTATHPADGTVGTVTVVVSQSP
jgi:hypothetical protein